MSLLRNLFDNIFNRELEEYKSINVELQNGTQIKIDIIKIKED